MGAKKKAISQSGAAKAKEANPKERTPAELVLATSEIEAMIAKLNVVDIAEKKAAVDKLSNQVGTLVSLYDSLTKQRAQNKIDYERILSERITNAQKADATGLDSILPDLSRRIDDGACASCCFPSELPTSANLNILDCIY